jgi:hypothetical protein
MSHLRVIPSIEQLRQRESMRALETRYGRSALIDALRAETASLRDQLGSGAVAAVTVTEAIDTIERGAEARLRAAMRPSLVGVINATGVIIHTNLGRAPLAASAIERAQVVAFVTAEGDHPAFVALLVPFLGYYVGSLLLDLALWRGRVAPAWVAALIVAGLAAEFVAPVAISNYLMFGLHLVAYGWLGLQALRPARPTPAGALALPYAQPSAFSPQS